MKSKVNWIITDHNIVVNYNGQTHTVARNGDLGVKLIDAIKQKKYEEIPELVSVSKRIEKFSNGQFTVNEGQVYVNGVLAPPVLGDKIVKFSNEGLPFEPLVKFAERLQKNPSFRAVNELFQFLEKNDHPITDTGCFIAYKKVRDDFKDVHSGTMDNSVGNVVSLPRNQVNEDPNQTCSYGLHVANWNYASNFYAGGVMLEVEVDPAHVVAVPVDYNQSKMRVCEYKVLGVVDRENSSDCHIRYTQPSFEKVDLEEDEEDMSCEDCDCYDVCSKNCSKCVEHDEYPWEDELE